MKKFEVYNDNSGGIALFTFDENGTVDFFNNGYEFKEGSLLADLRSLKNGELYFDKYAYAELYDIPLEEMYEEYSSGEVNAPILIADNDGIYPYHNSEYMLPELGINVNDFWDNIYEKYIEEHPITPTGNRSLDISIKRNRPFPWNYLNK